MISNYNIYMGEHRAKENGEKRPVRSLEGLYALGKPTTANSKRPSRLTRKGQPMPSLLCDQTPQTKQVLTVLSPKCSGQRHKQKTLQDRHSEVIVASGVAGRGTTAMLIFAIIYGKQPLGKYRPCSYCLRTELIQSCNQTPVETLLPLHTGGETSVPITIQPWLSLHIHPKR